MNLLRMWVITALLLGASVLVHLRGNTDRVPESTPLDQFPASINGWTSHDIPIAANVLDVLGNGKFLNRVYDPPGVVPATDTTPIGFFVGYFPTQRTGQSIHSPQNCLPGSGWTFESSGVTDIVDATGHRYQVGEYVVSNGVYRQEVLYWYRTQGHNIANDYLAKARILEDSILYDRTDAALVRVMTPLRTDETRAQAHLRVVHFTQQISPLLPAYIPN